MTNDIMRINPRSLTKADIQNMNDVKTLGEDLYELINTFGDSRELSLAKTKVEEAVMWTTKHITK